VWLETLQQARALALQRARPVELSQALQVMALQSGL
jgi:hypothetical protein